MPGPQVNDTNSSEADNQDKMSLRELLLLVIPFCVILLLIMLGMAFGPSAVGFGAVVFVLALAIMVHRYRFSLRTFLLVVTVLSIWLGLKFDRDIKLNRAITSLTNNGGQIKTCDPKPDFPWGLWKYRYDLNFYGLKDPLAEKDFVALETFAPSSLKSLDLSNTGITDEGLQSIANLADLEILLLANQTYTSGRKLPNRPLNQITDAGLVHLRQLTKLRGIDLNGTDVTDEGLRMLSQMPNLIWVYLDGTKVEGPGLAHLRNHNNLCMIELNGCPLTPVACQELVQWPSISSIGLRYTETTDEDLKLLMTIANPSILRIGNTSVSDEAVEQFRLKFPACKVDR